MYYRKNDVLTKYGVNVGENNDIPITEKMMCLQNMMVSFGEGGGVGGYVPIT